MYAWKIFLSLLFLFLVILVITSSAVLAGFEFGPFTKNNLKLLTQTEGRFLQAPSLWKKSSTLDATNTNNPTQNNSSAVLAADTGPGISADFNFEVFVDSIFHNAVTFLNGINVTGNSTIDGNLNLKGALTGATIDAPSNTITGLTNSNLSGSAAISNANLANSSIIFAADSGSGATNLGGTVTIKGGGINNAVYSNGTLIITGSEADTLDSVTSRGASTANALNLSSSSNKITVSTLTATGGSIDGIAIGASSSSTGAFTRLSVLANGAVSAPPLSVSGTWFTGGTTTTTKPQFLLEPSGATSTAWSTSGTGVGINSSSAFVGNLIDAQVNGSSKFSVDYQGNLTIAGSITGGSSGNQGFWNRTGTTISPATTGDSLTIGGTTSLNGNTTIGSATSNLITFTGRVASGTSLIPAVNLGSDLGSSSLRFNNLYVGTVNSNATLSTTGQALFTYEPTDTTYGQSSVEINPTNPVTNGFLLGIGVAGAQRAGIDAEGDLSLGYAGGVGTSAPNASNPFNVYNHSTTRVASIDTSGNLTLSGSTLNASSLATLTSASSLSLNPTSGTSYTFDTSGTSLTAWGTPTTVTAFGAATTLQIGASTGTATIANATINLSNGVLQTGGTQRLSNAGALSNITGFTQTSGAFSSTLTTSNAATFASSISGSDSIAIKPQSSITTNGFTATLSTADLTVGNQTFLLPDLAAATSATICVSGQTCASSGILGYWSRSGTTLSAATANDLVSLTNAATGQTTSNLKLFNAASSGTFDTTAGILTNYGGYFSNTSTRSASSNALTNVGLYSTASGAQNNYAAIFDQGNVGIGTTTPGAALQVTSTGTIKTLILSQSSPSSNPDLLEANGTTIDTNGDLYTTHCGAFGSSSGNCTNAQLYVVNGTPARIGLQVTGNAGQSAELLKLTAPSGTVPAGTTNGLTLDMSGDVLTTNNPIINGINVTGITSGSSATTALAVGTGWTYGATFASGNVGIGTTAPTQSLTVSGNILADLQAEKVTNGSFTGNANGWTLTSGWTYNSNNVIHAASGGTTTLSQNVSAVANESYTLTFTVAGRTAGSVTPTIGGVAGTLVSSNSTSTQVIIATGTGNLIFTPTTDFDGTIDDVSVKKGSNIYVQGNIGIGTTTPTSALQIGSGQILAPAGVFSAPSYSFSSATSSGIYYSSGIILNVGGNGKGYQTNIGYQIDSGEFFGWSPDANVTNASDLKLFRDAAATLQMGADSASPIAQTFKGADSRAGTDTDTAGGSLSIAGGRGTGTAAGGNLIFQLSPNGASTANTANALATVLTLDARTTTSGVAGLSYTPSARTVASGSSAFYNAVAFTPGTLNLTGTTQITGTGTSANNSMLFNQPTIAGNGNLTVDQASNTFINGPTISSSSSGTTTITAASALRIGAGSALNGSGGSVTNGYGIYVDAPTGATNNYAANFAANSLVTGAVVNISSSSTALTTGNLTNSSYTGTAAFTGNLNIFDYSPGSVPGTAASGDILRVNLGANGSNFTGNLFNVMNNASSVFAVSQAAVTSSLPTNFTSPGDMGIAYDLNFTNPIGSIIKSSAPLTLQSGETFNSSPLTLRTYNSGALSLDLAGGAILNQAQNWVLSASSTAALTFQDASLNTILNLDSTNDRVGIGTTAPGSKLEIDSTTLSNKGLIIKSTDNDSTNNSFEIQNSTGVARVALNPLIDPSVSGVNYIFATNATIAANGAYHVLDVRNNASNLFSVTTGGIYTYPQLITQGISGVWNNGSPSLSIGNNAGDILRINTSSTVLLWKVAGTTGNIVSNVANGGSAVGLTFDTTNSLTTAGAKLISFQNAAAEKSFIDKDGGYNVAYSLTSQTGNNLKLINATNTGTFDTTSGVLTNYGGYFSSTATRAAGSNNLTNIGLYSTASGAQNNYAAIFDQGNVGIGTTAPTQSLTVSGNILADLQAEKVTNGSFTGNANGWTLTSGWTYNSNNVIHAASGGTTTLSQNVSAVANESYTLTFTVAGRTAGSVTPTIGGVAGTLVSSNSTSTQVIIATGTGNLIFTPTTDFDGTIDDVSVKKGSEIYAMGKVGIGTTTPSSALQIVGGSISVPAGLSSSPSIYFGTNSTSGLYAASSNSTSISVSGAEKFRVDGSGTVVYSFTNFQDYGNLSLGATGDTVLQRAAASSLSIGAFSNAVTLTSSSSLNYNMLTIPVQTVTLSGSTNVTTTNGLNLVTLNAPTYTSASALTITNAATETLVGAPVASGAGPASITNAYALNILAGSALTNTTNGYGLAVNAPTGAGTNYAAVFSGGNVGIGTTTPHFTLSGLATTNSANAFALTNLSTTADTSTSVLRLNIGTATSDTNARFLEFYGGASADNNGTRMGRIQLNSGGVAYNTGNADFAEYFDVTEKVEPGDLITTGNGGNHKSQTGESLIGVVSDSAGFVGNAKVDKPDSTHAVVALTGQVYTKVSTENGPILTGDYLTISSTTAGVAMKASKPGQVVGKALENYASPNPGKILVLVNVGFADPNSLLASLQLDSAGNLVSTQVTTTPDLTKVLGGSTPPVTSNNPPALPSTTTTPINNSTTQQASVQDSQNSQLQSLKDQVASISANLKQKEAQGASDSAKLADLEKRIKSLEDNNLVSTNSARVVGLTNAPQASSSALLNLSPLDASASATFAQISSMEASTSAKLADYQNLTIHDSLVNFGKTTLADTLVAGTLMVDGTFSISQNSINVVGLGNTDGILFLQNSPLAQSLDLFNGQVKIDKSGNINTQGEITTKKLNISGASLGSGMITAGETSTVIKTSQITNNSKVFVTPTSFTGNQVLVVTSQTAGLGFTVETENSYSKDINFNWWIVDQNPSPTSQLALPSAQPSASPAPTTTPQPQLSTTTITINQNPLGFLRVRENPNTTSTELAHVYPDETYLVLEQKGGWSKIEYKPGFFGYVNDSLVTINSQ